MNRKELVSVLKKVSPALSSRGLIPIYSCLCFADKAVHAYDDVVALQFPLESGVTGGLKGDLLIDFLDKCAASESTVDQEGSSVTFKVGRSKLTTPAVPEADFLFKRPKTEGAAEVNLKGGFVEAIAKASVSMGRDPSQPWRLGVTVVVGDAGETFYATDNKTAVRVRRGKPPKDEAAALVVILPPRFVELLQDMSKGDPPLKMYVTKGWAHAKFSSGLTLFTRTVKAVKLEMFHKVFEGVRAKKLEMVPVPGKLAAALRRAEIIIRYAKEPRTNTRVAGGKAVLHTKSPHGEIRDVIKFAYPSDVDLNLSPDLVLRVLPTAETIAVHKDYVVLQGKGFTYVVSTIKLVGQAAEEDGAGAEAADEVEVEE